MFLSGTHRQFRVVISKLGIETTYIDPTDLPQLEAAIKDNTKVWLNFLCDVCLETPTYWLTKQPVLDMALMSINEHICNSFLHTYILYYCTVKDGL